MTDDPDLFGNTLPAETKYDLTFDNKISASELRRADREIQMEVMEVWFGAHFEDPCVSTPYITSEGGYQYIHGGPYDALEELQSEFEGIVPDDVIEEKANELNNISSDWTGISDNDLDDYAYSSIIESPKHFGSFLEALTNTLHLTAVDIPPPQSQHFNRLLYLSAIIAFETYLSDSFITKVTSDQALVRKFVETDKFFSKDNVPIREVFKFADEANKKVKDYLLKLVWHRITSVQHMFLDTLGVKFPDMTEIEDAIRVRHDIVHRGGKTTEGVEHHITQADIEKLCSGIQEAALYIEDQMTPPPGRTLNSCGNNPRS